MQSPDRNSEPLALTTPYFTEGPVRLLNVFEGPIEVLKNGEWVGGKGTVELRWLPQPKLIVRVVSFTPQFTEIISMERPSDPFLTLRFPITGLVYKADMFRRGEHHGLNKQSTYTLEAEFLEPFTIGIPSEVPNVEVLINNLQLHPTNQVQEPKRGWTGENILINAEWKITIHAPFNQKSLKEALNIDGGYAVTHVARVERINGALFTLNDFKEAWEPIAKYLSFLSGRNVNGCLVIGKDAKSDTLWESWEILGPISPWKKITSWQPQAVTDFDTSIDKFCSLHMTPDWSEVLDTYLEWYTQAQNSDEESTSILFAHLAIELLAWAEFVEINRIINVGSFQKLDAADRIRLLLNQYSVPTGIPAKFTGIESYRRNQQSSQTLWDGPKVIAEFRNQLAHPNLRHKLKGFSKTVRTEIKHLALWYVELALLRLTDYEGGYFSRAHSTYTTEVHSLPWH